MKRALIGYTGFVGSTIAASTYFEYQYNSKNISEIEGKNFDLVVCAAPSAVKWLANKEPEADLRMVEKLINHLKNVKTERMVLISTVDVYPRPIGADEFTPIDMGKHFPYGKNRYILEQEIQRLFPVHTIIRLPGLFGAGLKKNAIFDLLHHNREEAIDKDSFFQWYDIQNIWKDIQISMKSGISVVNIATEPVSMEEVADKCFDRVFTNKTSTPPIYYDMRTLHSDVWGQKKGVPYIYMKEEVLRSLKEFVKTCTV